MFDAILRPEKRSTSYGAGATIAVAFHVVALGVLLGMGSKPRPIPVQRTEQTVTFFVKKLPKLVAVPPARVEAPKQESIAKRQPVKRPVLVATLTPPNDSDPISEREITPPTQETPQESTALAAAEINAVSSEGEVGGAEGGMQGGTEGAEAGKPKRVDVLPFGEGMKEPQLLTGEDPQYSREAIAAGVEGTMLFKCVITLEGHIERCRVIKPLPHMVAPVLTALASRRYTPVLFQGQPVTVEKLFQVKLVLPHR